MLYEDVRSFEKFQKSSGPRSFEIPCVHFICSSSLRLHKLPEVLTEASVLSVEVYRILNHEEVAFCDSLTTGIIAHPLLQARHSLPETKKSDKSE